MLESQESKNNFNCKIDKLQHGILFYKQIERDILRDIKNNIYKFGDKIFTEKQLIEKYNTSITTVRKAIENLCSQKILVKHQGKGTFVRNNRKRIGIVSPYISDSWLPMWNALDVVLRAEECIFKLYPFKFLNIDGYFEQLNLCQKENDGMIVFPSYYENSTMLNFFEYLLETKYPFVFVDKSYKLSQDVNLVTVDYYYGFNLLLDELSQKHKSIAVLIDFNHSTGYELFRLCIDKKINSDLIKKGNFFEKNDEIHKAIDELLKSTPTPDAIICFSSKITDEVISYLQRKNINVPDDIEIAGAGEINFISRRGISMHVLKFPREQIGEKVGKLIVENLNNENMIKESFYIKPELNFINNNLKMEAGVR